MSWPAPIKGTMCPIKLPRCFTPQDLEKHNYTITWHAPNETAQSYVLLLLARFKNASGLPFTIDFSPNDLTVTATRP